MQFIRDERTPKDIRGRLPCMQFIETLHSCVRRKTCCQLLWGKSENTENYEYCITFQRTFVHDCRSWVIILYRTVSFKISSYSRPYVRIMHESTKAQISLRPSLGKETFNLKNRSICDDIQTCKVSTSRFLPPSLFIILFFPWFYYYYHCYYFFIIIFFWPNC